MLAELGEQCLIEDSAQEIYDMILKEAAKIGWYRYLASLAELRFRPNKYRVSFRNISIVSSMLDKDEITIDPSIIETDVMRSSRDRFSFADLATVLDIGKGQANDVTDLSISQGHDIFEIFSIGIEKKWGRRSIRSDLLESHTRLAYEREDFLLTTVYDDLNTWELANKPYKIFLAS